MRRQRCLILSTNILNFSITFPTPVTYENYSLEVLLQTLPCLQKKIICRLVTISYCSHEMLYIVHILKENPSLACDQIWSYGNHEMTNLVKFWEQTKSFWSLTR